MTLSRLRSPLICCASFSLMTMMGTVWSAFSAQTEIWTLQGLRPLQQLQPGDLVVSTCEGREALRSIESLTGPQLTEGVVLQTEASQPLICSAEQLFWTLRGWQKAADLECGEALLCADGRWVPLLFPPLSYPLQAMVLCLQQLNDELNTDECIFWAGSQKILCHNDCLSVPIVTVMLASGQVIVLSGLTLASAVLALGAKWVVSELETRLNRLGYPDTHVLSVEMQWTPSSEPGSEETIMSVFSLEGLKPWFEQPEHLSKLDAADSRQASLAPTPRPWADLPAAAKEALMAQLEQALVRQLPLAHQAVL